MDKLLALKHLKPVAVGKQRYVFVHPLDPGLIVKVPTEVYVHRRTGEKGKWYKAWRRRRLRSRHFLVNLREIGEQLALRAAAPEIPRYVQTIVGFVETDMGMGLVSRAVRGRDGQLAPTLTTILSEGRFDRDARQRLDEFFAWLIESPVVVADLNTGNIVYGFDPEFGDRFILIDGLGDKNLIPFCSMSQRLNRMSKLRRIARIKAQLDRYEPAERRAAAGNKPPRLLHQGPQ